MSHEATQTAHFAAVLSTLENVMPGMTNAARRRAAWAVAHGQLNLANAIKAEGYSLEDGGRAAAPAAAKPAPKPAAPAARVAAPAARVAAPAARPAAARDIAVLRDAAALAMRAHLEGRGSKAAAEAAKNVASASINAAARALQKRQPGMTYAAAVVEVTR